MFGKVSSALVVSGLIAAAVVVPTSGAGADSGCLVWGTLPTHVALSPQGVTMRTTLRGTSDCTGSTADNGATATLVGPSGEHSVPIRWYEIDGSDQVTLYPSLDRVGTYQLVDGQLQAYDAQYELIRSEWHATTMYVKYVGGFSGVSRSATDVSATLQMYGPTGWYPHADVPVSLQESTSTGWHTIGSTRSSSSGSVHITAHTSTAHTYRLVSATSAHVWSAGRTIASSAA